MSVSQSLVREAGVVVQGIRQDAVLLKVQHPDLHTLHARLLQAAVLIERLARELAGRQP